MNTCFGLNGNPLPAPGGPGQKITAGLVYACVWTCLIAATFAIVRCAVL